MYGNIDKTNKLPPPATPTGEIRIFHPVSGLVVLGTDYLFFGVEIFAITLPLACLSSFLISFTLVFMIQRRLDNNRAIPALLKAVAAGIAAGLPTPITGTIIGTAIILMSGLPKRP